MATTIRIAETLATLEQMQPRSHEATKKKYQGFLFRVFVFSWLHLF